ncbi:hypothetical protein QTN25_000374 [Entamoeba marina]
MLFKLIFYLSIVTNCCVSCPVGEYQPFDNYTNSSCFSCPDGYGVSNNESTCSVCPSGSYSSSDHKCVQCADNQFQKLYGQLRCYTCETGKYPNPSHTDCVSCPEGTYGITGRCIKCPIGYYSNKTNSLHCSMCDELMYQSFEGSNNCSSCPYNEYSNEERSGCLSCGIFKNYSYKNNVCNNHHISNRVEM